MSEVGHLSIFVPSLEGGGAERNMLNLARGFDDRGLSVDLVLAKAEGPYLDQVPTGMRVVDLGDVRLLPSLPNFVRYLRQERPVVLISAMDHANVAALWARRIARVPTLVLVGVRNTLSQETQHATQTKQRLIPFLVRAFYPWADAIVAVSRGVANDLARIKGLSRKGIHIIYNPVVTSELLAAARAPSDHPWFSPGEPPVVLGTGRLTPQKDFPTLIRAFAFMRARRPGRLVILGEGEERPRLEALVSQLGIEDDVVLPGFVENPYAYMTRAAAFVLSSTWEGLPTVIIEALACGTPVVSTDCPSGPAEILEGGRYGRLVPVGDVEGLARAIMHTLDTYFDAEMLRRRAGEFTVDRIVDQYLEVLEGLLYDRGIKRRAITI